MENLSFPLSFEFKVTTLANDFVIKDAQGQLLSYVRQKMFKLKEDILCFADPSKTRLLYRIRANQWIDFSATYTFFDAYEKEMGRVARKGAASIWRATYQVFDLDQHHEFTIREENPWTKVMDFLLTEIPLVGIFTGYFLNPSYIVLDAQHQPVIRLKKEPSFWGRKFSVIRIAELEAPQMERLLLSLMMMVLLERRRG
jgi:hypothetical protein